jgi:MFS family permease
MTDAEIEPVLPVTPQRISARQVAAAVMGNAIEFYDFLIYAFFAVQISHAFFPDAGSPFLSLMATLVTFGVGFIMRPIGAVVIGLFADRVGRRPAMLFTLGLMGFAILGLALTPNYASIGVAAPILVVIWRLCQGFALGGEVGPTTAFLVEASPVEHRGFYSAWQGASQGIANLTGGLVGIALVAGLGEQAVDAWGWRIAFAIGALTLPFGLIIRRGLPETLHHGDEAVGPREESTLAHILASLRGLAGHWRIIALGMALILSGTIPTYVLNFLTTYAITTLGMPTSIAVASPLFAGVATLGCALLSGALSDRIGRKPLMIWPRLVLIFAALPIFQFMVSQHSAFALLGGAFVLSCLLNFASAAALVAITESLRKDIRGAGVSIIYSFSVAIFGGTTQPIILQIIHTTGNPLAPAYYMIGACVIGLIAALLMKETAPLVLRAREAAAQLQSPVGEGVGG